MPARGAKRAELQRLAHDEEEGIQHDKHVSWARDLYRIYIVVFGEALAIIMSVIMLTVFPTALFTPVMVVDIVLAATIVGILLARTAKSAEMMAYSLIINCGMAIFILVGMGMLIMETVTCRDALHELDDARVQTCYSNVKGVYDNPSTHVASQVSVCLGTKVGGAFNGLCPDVVHGTKGTAFVVLQFINMTIFLICQAIIGFFETRYIANLLLIVKTRHVG